MRSLNSSDVSYQASSRYRSRFSRHPKPSDYLSEYQIKSKTKNKQKGIFKQESQQTPSKYTTFHKRTQSNFTIKNSRLQTEVDYSQAILVEGFPDFLSIQDLWECFLEMGPVSNIQMAASSSEAIVTFSEPCVHPKVFQRPFYYDRDIDLYLSRHYPTEKEIYDKSVRCIQSKIFRTPENIILVEKQRDQTKVNGLHRKLFVRKLSSKLDEDQLINFFSQYGKVVSSEIVKDLKTGKSRGYGFLLFHSSESIRRVLLDVGKIILRGKLIECRVADEKHQPLQHRDNLSQVYPDNRARFSSDGLRPRAIREREGQGLNITHSTNNKARNKKHRRTPHKKNREDQTETWNNMRDLEQGSPQLVETHLASKGYQNQGQKADLYPLEFNSFDYQNEIYQVVEQPNELSWNPKAEWSDSRSRCDQEYQDPTLPLSTYREYIPPDKYQDYSSFNRQRDLKSSHLYPPSSKFPVLEQVHSDKYHQDQARSGHQNIKIYKNNMDSLYGNQNDSREGLSIKKAVPSETKLGGPVQFTMRQRSRNNLAQNFNVGHRSIPDLSIRAYQDIQPPGNECWLGGLHHIYDYDRVISEQSSDDQEEVDSRQVDWESPERIVSGQESGGLSRLHSSYQEQNQPQGDYQVIENVRTSQGSDILLSSKDNYVLNIGRK